MLEVHIYFCIELILGGWESVGNEQEERARVGEGMHMKCIDTERARKKRKSKSCV